MLTLICLAASLAAAPPVEVPIPAGRHLFAANGWRVVDHAVIVPGTERNRAQSFDHRVYVGRIGSDSGRLVFSCRSTKGSPHVLDVRPDGTVLFDIYPSRMVWVGPGDPVAHFGDGEPLRLLGPGGDLRLLHANRFGVVAARPDLNTVVKVFFVPLEGRKPDVEKKVELDERGSNDIYHTTTGYHVSERWVLWGGREIRRHYTRPMRGKVVAFDGKDLKRWDVPVPEDSAILGVDGDLAVLRHGKGYAGDREGEIDTFDLAARKKVTTYSTVRDTRLLAIRGGVGYFSRPMPSEVGKRGDRYEVFALDLLRKRDPLSSKEVQADRHGVRAIPMGKGVMVVADPPVTIPWAKRP